MGSLLGPIVGGTIYQYYGYKFTMDLWMISLFITIIIYAVFNCGLHPIKKAN
jgi:dipeptide/tripeptide permease